MSFEMNFIGLALVRNVINQKDSLCHNNIFFSLQINHLGAPYDTCSVMHYGAYAFSKVSYFQI